MTTALITGIGGFVGSYLAEHLLAETQWDIAGTLRTGEPLDSLETLGPTINHPDSRVTTYDADITDAGSMARLVATVAPDYVYHLAAQSFPVASFANPAQTLETNIIGTLHVLEACRVHCPDAWIQVCSSAEVYGKTKTRAPMDESTPFHPASPYSISKIGTDLLGQLYASYGVNVIVTRMFTHTGPRRGDVFAESTFAKQIAMIEAGMIEPPIRVGNLESVRTIADVRDAVRAYRLALTVNPKRGAVYNIGGVDTLTVGEILDLLFELSGTRYPVAIDPVRVRAVDADFQIPDCTRFCKVTGWEPTIDARTTLRDLLEYWRARVRRVPVLQR